MPVTDEGEDQDQPGDHQQSSGFQGIDLRRAVMFEGRVIGRMWIRLSFWTRRRHSNIVAPESNGVAGFWRKLISGFPNFTEPG